MKAAIYALTKAQIETCQEYVWEKGGDVVSVVDNAADVLKLAQEGRINTLVSPGLHLIDSELSNNLQNMNITIITVYSL